MILASIPSPDQGVWHLGPLPIRAYALCILLGVVVAIWLGERRWAQRGGQAGAVSDIAVWAIPFGLVGARLYHVITDPQLYFGEGKSPITALYVWRGGLGIWGAIALGALGAYIGCRRGGIKFTALADALAPGIALAQGIGRWGNWFNQELYGKPTTLPWGLQIDPAHRGSLQQYETFHPTFLYESIWDVGVAGVVIWADRRFKLGFGRAFAVYVMAYTLGRGFIEYMRVDTVNHILGMRLNVWTSIVVFLLAAVYFIVSAKRHPGREAEVQVLPGSDDETVASDDQEVSLEDADGPHVTGSAGDQDDSELAPESKAEATDPETADESSTAGGDAEACDSEERV